MTRQARNGYALAVAAAAISGGAVYVNSLGVGLFKDAATYTTLKNGVTGILALVPLLALGAPRAELRRLTRAEAGWLAVLAVISGSVPFLLFFRGLQLSGPVAGALFNHLQFAVVAILAAAVLRERITMPMWVGLAALVVVTNFGIDLGAVRLGTGTALLTASTVLFAAGFVVAKHLLRRLSTTTVMAARMSLGSLLLLGYLATTGGLGGLAHLRAGQWLMVLGTGAILFAFTATTLAAIKRAPVSVVLAISMASPLVTLLLQAARSGHLRVAPADGLTLVAVAAVVVLAARGMPTARRPRLVSGLRQD